MNPTPFDPAAIMAASRKRNRDVYGLPVRCPVCDAGIGKFCLVDMTTPHESMADVVIHAARVRLARIEP